MNFNIFSKKKKQEKGSSLEPTNFLDPRNKGENKKEESRSSKENKKTEYKEEDKEEKKEVEAIKGKKESKNIKKEEDKKQEKHKEKENKEEKKERKGGGSHLFKKSNILEINLVKDEVNVYFDWYKNIAILILFVFLSFILVAEIYWALSWWHTKSTSEVRQETEKFVELNEQTRELRVKAQEALIFKDKLSKANYLLNNHIYWSNFFKYLENNTIENVEYMSFKGNLNGNFKIPATASNFPNLGKQVYQFYSNPNTLDVAIDSAEKIQNEDEEDFIERVNFSINLIVKPELFKNKE